MREIKMLYRTAASAAVLARKGIRQSSLAGEGKLA
jgi:hypothetical protein